MPSWCCACGDPEDVDDAYRRHVDPAEGQIQNPATVSTAVVGAEDFELLRVLGRGTYGKVVQVRKRDTGTLYAMKIMRKEDVLLRNQVKHTLTERHVLQTVRHPFIVGLQFAFQTDQKLYLVLPFMSGGELFFHLRRERAFPEARVLQYAAEILLALQELHRHDVVYRDLKPENVLMDAEGHLALSDFGLAKEAITTLPGGASTFCGSPSYMAPEVLLGTGHGFAVDWWSFGTLVYEMLVGVPPFYSRNLHAMYRAILHGELRIPKSVGAAARSLLEALLRREVPKRLGTAGDAERVRRHRFFRSVDFAKVLARGYAPAFKPPLKDSSDTANFDATFTDEPVLDSISASDPAAVLGERHAEAAEAFVGWDSFSRPGGGGGAARGMAVVAAEEPGSSAGGRV